MQKILNKFKATFRALSNRNYRLFFMGQGVSLTGTWMQSIALAWLVYRMTNSAFLLGFVGFLSQILIFIFGPFAGVVADRFDRYKIVIVTQVLAMIQAFILAFLVMTNNITIWQIMLLSLMIGMISAFDIPSRQSFVIQMVEKKEDLNNAIALNSSLVNAARLIGPTVAGIIIGIWGEGICFLINAISFIAVLYSLLIMKIKPYQAVKKDTHVIADLIEGIKYAYNFTPIRYILLTLAMTSLFGSSYLVLMPVYTREVFHGGPQVLGYLMTAAGTGALIGALYLASRKNVRGLSNLIAIAASIYGVGVISISFCQILWLAPILIMITGFGMMVNMASSNTILQTIVDDNKRGRVMSLFTMSFMGMAPIGSLLSGSLAHYFGVSAAILFSGITSCLFALVYFTKLPQIKSAIRPTYIKMGILPEVVNAINVTTELSQITKKE